MSEQDRRLVLIVQGDDTTVSMQFWLETPCDEHGGHVVTNELHDVEATHIESPHTWLLSMLQAAADNLCLCGARQAPDGSMKAVFEATRA